MGKQTWAFKVTSEGYGTDYFGEYETEQDAYDGLARVKAKAKELNDGITRYYSEPFVEVE